MATVLLMPAAHPSADARTIRPPVVSARDAWDVPPILDVNLREALARAIRTRVAAWHQQGDRARGVGADDALDRARAAVLEQLAREVLNDQPRGRMDAQTLYFAWLAAVARSNRTVAGAHADALRHALATGDRPEWSAEAEQSFHAWCDGAEPLDREVHP